MCNIQQLQALNVPSDVAAGLRFGLEPEADPQALENREHELAAFAQS
jgi:hypothetical protein